MKYKIAIICPKDEINNYAFSDSFETKILSYDNILSNDPEVSFHDFLNNNIELIKNSQGILISYRSTWQEAIMIVLHLRLTHEWNIQKQPIIWDSEEKYTKIALEATISGFNKSFIPTKTTQHFNRNELPEELNVDREIEEKFLNADKSNERISLEQIFVKSLSSGHQITNEWGAFKLAQTAKFNDLLSKIEETQHRSKTIYFKYLKNKYPIAINAINTEGVSTSNNISAKYLLIDDNYDKGWKLVFEEVLKQVNLGLDAFEDIKNINLENEGELIVKIKRAIENVKYQGVLLDLRLTTADDEKGKSNTNITNFTGGRILKALKEKFPFLPVIMVTASNKAWNMQQLLDGGADGYFIKEDPESNPSDDVSKSTYEAFVQLIRGSQNKYKTLAPFWKYINEIKENPTLITERDGSIVQERIRERLIMFFGLLKRSFEDSKYNEQFHYSDKALAFMTLWSCLNDIQYIYFIKTKTPTNNNNYVIEIKIEPNIALHKNVPSDFQILTRRKGTSSEVESYIKENWVTKTFDIPNQPITPPQWNGKKDRSQSIGHQIAILLNAFSFSDNLLNEKLLKRLFDLKEKRNALYLIHGNEDPNKSFFKRVEKNNTEITLEDCTQLFEIVYFLLTGNYVQINM